MTRSLPIAALLLLAVAGVLMVVGPPRSRVLAEEDPKGCVDCHETPVLRDTSHETLAKTLGGGACASCHGSGEDHARAPEKHPLMKGLTPAKAAEPCLACHLTGPDHVSGWKDTEYAREGKTCSDCHTVHEASDRRLGLAADERGDVGDEACRMCHQPVFAELKASFHAVVIGKVGGGCEACHGPGRDHVEAARALTRGEGRPMIAREPEQASCLLCHRAVPERHAREMPTYREQRPNCVVCHDVHVSRSDPLYAVSGDPVVIPEEKAGSEACSTCHVDGVSSARGSVHASVVTSEGCERCHGPAAAHVKSGGRKRFIVSPEKQGPEMANALCLSCHGDRPKHARSFMEGPLHRQGLTCLTCHAAHGGREGQGRPLPSGQPVVGKATRVGSATCAICHEEPHPGILESPHATLVESGDSGCEQCHGPGSAHVLTGGSPERILSPARMPKERRAQLCLACHGREPGRVSWRRGEHARAGLTCATCHDPLTSPEKRSVKREPDLCMVCHQDVAAQFRLPNRHPLGRGAVTCGSCHDPHGDKSGPLSLELRKERCTTCHRDKCGPFLFEHEADRQDGCVACHVPHGSANRRLLTHRRVSDLCIQCHVTPASHNLARGSAFRNCLNCHGNIHGSYVDEKFFR